MEEHVTQTVALEAAALSAKSHAMLALRDAVLHDWEVRLRADVKHASTLRHPILINTLPVFFEKLSYLLTPAFLAEGAIDTSTIATEHGGERARTTGYDIPALIHEYQLFRRCLFRAARARGIELDRAEAEAINAAIDNALRNSATAFALVHAALREQFVAALTHDLRNPLSNVRMAAQLLLQSGDPDTVRRMAQTIVDNTGRMDAMIHQLLDTIALQSEESLPLHLAQFDLKALVEKTVALNAQVHQWPVRVHGEAVTGWWCRASLVRVIENLIGNAVKYGRPGAAITIGIGQGYERVQLAVHNEGMPIPAGQQEAIFQSYRRTQAAREGKQDGWGIGLPYVRRVAESHGGSVIVSSSAEAGTTFTVDLPQDARPYCGTPALS